VKNFLLFIVLLVAAVSILLLVRFNKENNDVTRILEQERFGRMTAEEELQKGEYRIKKLEADLQTTQVKMSRNQEGIDKCKDENAALKVELERATQQGRSQEDDLRRGLDEANKKKSELEVKLREAGDALRDAREELRQAKAQAEAAERKAEQQAVAAAAIEAAAKK
jgi:predicted  nucleic acid-binding Zn-ribbon protein